MGNVTGAGLGPLIGALGEPVGEANGISVGGAVGMSPEITNSTNIHTNSEGNGRHHLDDIPSSVKSMKVRRIWVIKTDLPQEGINTAASFGRAILAPMSTIMTRNKQSLMEHWFVIFDVVGSGWLVTYKSVDGIFLHHVSTWGQAIRYSGSNRTDSSSTVKKYEYTCESERRSVQDIIDFIRERSSYYALNGENSQDYANEVYCWF